MQRHQKSWRKNDKNVNEFWIFNMSKMIVTWGKMRRNVLTCWMQFASAVFVLWKMPDFDVIAKVVRFSMKKISSDFGMNSLYSAHHMHKFSLFWFNRQLTALIIEVQIYLIHSLVQIREIWICWTQSEWTKKIKKMFVAFYFIQSNRDVGLWFEEWFGTKKKHIHLNGIVK